MLGRMQEWPLLMHKIIDFAAIQFPKQEVASRMVEGPMHRTTYAEIRERSLKVAKRLERDGIRLGDRVATLAWNGFRHLEAWYGITGLGAVYHTVNPRLFPEQIAWIINHAEDRIVMTDLTFVPLLETIADHLPSVERYIILTDAAHMPATKLKNAVAYETWLGEADADFRWAEFDERTAAGLCYTSGTTGNPKGVLYSHRSNVLHSMMATGPEVLTLNAYDSVLPVVPMFHANSWGLALSCLMRGARMVMPGAKLDGASVYDILETEKVTMTAAVPTVWLGLLQYLRKEGKRLTTLKFVGIGGSACPPEMIRAFEDDYGIEVRHAWGMTEMSPIGSAGAIKPNQVGMSHEEKLALQAKQGWAPFGVEMKIVDEENNELPWDGKRFGRLKVRGFAVVETYFRDEGGKILDDQGFFDTGDVATIDPNGFMADHRPSQGRHQVGRRMDLDHRHRESGRWSSRRRRGRGHRRPSRQVGRTAAARRRAEGGLRTQDGGGPRIPQTQDRQVVDARRHAGRARDSAYGDRQDQQAEAARDLQGL